MNMYKMVAPEKFTTEHIEFIEEFKKSIITISNYTDVILGAKDIYSRHIISTIAYANIVGFKNGYDVTGFLDKDMPCDGTSQYADSYVQEDNDLMNSLDINKSVSILNVHNYSNGIKAKVFKKKILYHEASSSILGTIYSGSDIELQNILNIMPSYIMRFGITGSIESIDSNRVINDVVLTDYEQELCFLFILNWEFKQIANFMDQLRPMITPRTADTIIKKKNYICNKFNIMSNRIKDLQDFLVSIGFHNKMPESFYKRLD